MKESLASLCLYCLIILLPIGSSAKNSHENRITGPFDSGMSVTTTCLRCHERQARDFIQHEHWTWADTQHVPGRKEEIEIGKKGGFNNFCIAVTSNWPACTSCHTGYGWKDESFDFDNIGNIDCLVCHDTTGTYEKDPTGAGMPVDGIDLVKIAKNVGRTSRSTCGSCHFFGGGGDHVKHGDLDTSLIDPLRTYDVHMGSDGLNATCQFCHQTTNHDIPGQAISVSAGEGIRVTCDGCHRDTPHSNQILNRHGRSVACQTCHIPAYAKDSPTKTWWDWSKAGEYRKPEKDKYGMDTYAKKKGEFRWGKNLIPVYAWYNGSSEHYVIGDKVSPAKTVNLATPLGGIADKNAKIHPFKVMQGKQPFDKENLYLVVANLFGGYWDHFNWNRAITDGMAAAKMPYSGEFGFVKTKMYWPITHTVVPKEQALKCSDCHSKAGRLDWKALGYADDPQNSGSRKFN